MLDALFMTRVHCDDLDDELYQRRYVLTNADPATPGSRGYEGSNQHRPG